MYGIENINDSLIKFLNAQISCVLAIAPALVALLILSGCNNEDRFGDSESEGFETLSPSAPEEEQLRESLRSQSSQEPSNNEPSENFSVLTTERDIDAFELQAELPGEWYQYENDLPLDVSPDGAHFITGGTEPRLWKVGDTEPIHKFDDLYNSVGNVTEATSVAVSMDGQVIALGGTDGFLHLFEFASGNFKKSFKAQDETIAEIALTADGSEIITSSYDGTVTLWTSHGEQRWTKQAGERRAAVGISPDGNFILIGGYEVIPIICSSEGQVLRHLDFGDERYPDASSIEFSLDGKRIAAIHGFNAVVWSAETFEQIGAFKHDFGVNSTSLSADAKFLATSDHEGQVHVWRIADQKRLQTMKVESVGVVDWVSSSQTLLTFSEEKIGIWARAKSQ